MRRAGDLFSAGRQKGVVGGFLGGRSGCVGVTACHIMRLAGTKNLTIGDARGKMIADWKPFDLVYIKAFGCDLTPLATPKLCPAIFVNAMGFRDCSISEVGDHFSLVISHANMPEPGDSRTTLYQDDEVVGILSTMILNTGKWRRRSPRMR